MAIDLLIPRPEEVIEPPDFGRFRTHPTREGAALSLRLVHVGAGHIHSQDETTRCGADAMVARIPDGVMLSLAGGRTVQGRKVPALFEATVQNGRSALDVYRESSNHSRRG
jgi:hypothetical protein